MAQTTRANSYGKYERGLLEEINKLYEIASKARQRSCDPTPEVESKIVFSHGETLEYLLGLKGLAERLKELLEQLPRTQIPFKMAEDVIYGRFGSFDDESKALLAVRAGLGCITAPGTTSAPLEGITKIKIKENPDRTRYLAIYFAGPMRSAGGTEQALSILIADFVRSALHLSKYIPLPDEIARFVEEYRLFEKKVGRFQYRISEEQLLFVLQRMPIEVTGIGTDPFEVLTYKNLPRIETNFIRGGALRVLIDGFIGRAEKVLKYVKELNLTGWDWLSEVKVTELEGSYMDEVLIGRPVFSSNDSFGGFRIRYGRARNTGLTAVGLHPNSMRAVDCFIAVGSQLRIDRPGKSGIVMPVDSIEPPIVKLKDGSVIKLAGSIDWNEINSQIDEVLFLGDILISVGDYIENNRILDCPGFTEEWWAAALKRKILEVEAVTSELLGIDKERLQLLSSRPLEICPDFKEALIISTRLGIPLHPRYVNFWERCTGEEVVTLCTFLKQKAIFEDSKIILPSENEIEKILRKALIIYRKSGNQIMITDDSIHFIHLLYSSTSLTLPQSGEDGLSYIARILKLPLKRKSGSTISARFGRPEAAKPRLMKPPVNVLFPVGNMGGPSRDIKKASEGGLIKVEIVHRKCPTCGSVTFLSRCPICSSNTVIQILCPKCGLPCVNTICKRCGSKCRSFAETTINLKNEWKRAQENVNIRSLSIKVKGVKSLMNDQRIPESLEKGILRAALNLFVYRDGTCRFDASNAPLTAFRPKEINTSLNKLLELGYDRDINGLPLTTEEQLVYLKLQDILVPRKALGFLLAQSKFLDRLLELYGLEPYYKISKEADLIGKHIISISPHTVGGIVGRIIGFTDAEVLFAHPYYHQAKRRDCDGDADSFTLALDVFMNFSRKYISDKPGGMMDSPLVVFPLINPKEVDDQVYNMENMSLLPLELYTLAESSSHTSNLNAFMKLVSTEAPIEILYTHDSSDIVNGPLVSKYRVMRSASDKLLAQLNLIERLPQLNKIRILQNMLDTHLIRDFSGNIRALYIMGFRCNKCGERYRRPPLSGRCNRCGHSIQPNVYISGAVKYFHMIELLTSQYNLDVYYSEAVKLLGQELKHLSLSESDRHLSKDTRYKIRRKGSLSEFLEFS